MNSSFPHILVGLVSALSEVQIKQLKEVSMLGPSPFKKSVIYTNLKKITKILQRWIIHPPVHPSTIHKCRTRNWTHSDTDLSLIKQEQNKYKLLLNCYSYISRCSFSFSFRILRISVLFKLLFIHSLALFSCSFSRGSQQ